MGSFRVLCAAVSGTGLSLALVSAQGNRLPSCDPDNGGLKLPPGLCALVVADNLGPARHAAVAPNGDLYVALRTGRGATPSGPGIVALRDADGDGRMEQRETFGLPGGTGIAMRNGYLYVATTTLVERYKMAPGQLKPAGEPETRST
jgi:glucose/arabinose dehydrogenase